MPRQSVIGKEFSRIITVNEALKKIADLSYQVKMRALNSLIIAGRSGTGLAGFAVISSELIFFSSQLQEMTDTLSALMETVLRYSTRKAGAIRNQSVMEKTSLKFQLSNEENALLLVTSLIERENDLVKKMDQEIGNGLQEIFYKIRETIKLCTRGRTIAVFGKIEAAYAIKDKEIYLQLSENVEEYLDEAEATLKQINISWT